MVRRSRTVLIALGVLVAPLAIVRSGTRASSRLACDRLHGEGGNDLVFSAAGTSTVDGGDGADWLVGASSSPTTLLGGAGTDYSSRWITPGEADSDIHTSTFSSIDYFTLWGSRWTFRGTEAPDFVQVLDAPLNAQGLGGDDYLLGGDRADVLDGGEGTDTAWGGRGRNTCIDTEAGECDGYPWDSDALRARILDDTATSPAHIDPAKPISRWINHEAPFHAP